MGEKLTYQRKLGVRLVLCIFIFYGCDTISNKKISEDNFIGVWEVVGRDELDGVRIEIKKDNQGKLKGYVKQVGNNKLVSMFIDSNDVFIKSIDRRSNYQFDIVEKRIAHKLFSIYGIDTDAKFKVQFNGEDFIDLSKNNKNSIGYMRVK